MSTFTRNARSGKWQVTSPSDVPSTKLNSNFDYEPVVDVRDFGAICDGVTDNRNAINSAVQAGAGGTIFFPAQASSYLWDPETKLPVAIPNNTRLLFAPGATIELRSAFGSICNAIFTNTNPAVDPDLWGVDHDIEIDGLRLISPVRPNNSAEWFAARQDWLAADRGAGGNGSDWPSVMYGWLSFKGVRRLTIRNLYVQGLTGFKVHFSRCRDVRCYETCAMRAAIRRSRSPVTTGSATGIQTDHPATSCWKTSSARAMQIMPGFYSKAATSASTRMKFRNSTLPGRLPATSRSAYRMKPANGERRTTLSIAPSPRPW
jgi:hypothetical protein